MTTEGMALQLRSLVRSTGELELSLVDVPIPVPGADEVLVRIEASPINPSDLGLLLGPADMTSAAYSGTTTRPVVTARLPEAAMAVVAGRLEHIMVRSRGGISPRSSIEPCGSNRGCR